MGADAFHDRLLAIVKKLPEAEEDWPWGSIHCKVAGKIFVGFDGDDHGLGYAVKEAGNGSFVFATDFPHESFDAKSCRIEIQHILSREDLTQADKEAILGANAKRFYGIH